MAPDDKLLAFENLVGETSAALAELLDAIKSGTLATGMVEASLSELVEVLKGRKDADISPLVKAVQALRLNAPVTVNVEPTPVQVNVQPAAVHVEIQQPPAREEVWEVTVAGRYGAPDRLMTIRKKSA